MNEWQTFLAVQAGAAATLTGLVFVAVSLNLARIMSVAGLPGRAGESILQLLQVFFAATVALIPRQSIGTLGAEILSIGVSSLVCQTAGHIRYGRSRKGHPWSWLFSRMILSELATIPICVAGAGLLLGMPGAFYWIVPGFIFSFIAGVVSAWVLLVEILR